MPDEKSLQPVLDALDRLIESTAKIHVASADKERKEHALTVLRAVREILVAYCHRPPYSYYEFDFTSSAS